MLEAVDTTVPSYIICNEEGALETLRSSIDEHALPHALFRSAEEFIQRSPRLSPGLLIIKLKPPASELLALLTHFRDVGQSWPAIVSLGHGDVRTAVRAMQLGAVDCLEKPLDTVKLFEAIDGALAAWDVHVENEIDARNARVQVSSLSPREHDVMLGMLSGLTSKELAIRIGLSHRTIEMHRARMMKQLGVTSASEVFDIAYRAGVAHMIALPPDWG